MSKRTLILIGVLAIVTAILIYIAVSPKKTPPPPAQTMVTPTPVSIATAHLTMNPLSVNATPSATSVDVVLESGASKITAVQLEISYDPKLLTNVDITPISTATSLLPGSVVLLKTIDTTKGLISLAIAVPPTAKAISGTGPVATIKFRSNSSIQATTSLAFLPKTLVTAEGVSASVLKDSIGATVFIQPATTAPAATTTTP